MIQRGGDVLGQESLVLAVAAGNEEEQEQTQQETQQDADGDEGSGPCWEGSRQGEGVEDGTVDLLEDTDGVGLGDATDSARLGDVECERAADGPLVVGRVVLDTDPGRAGVVERGVGPRNGHDDRHVQRGKVRDLRRAVVEDRTEDLRAITQGDRLDVRQQDNAL